MTLIKPSLENHALLAAKGDIRMLTRNTFRLEAHPNARALRDHPVWASYTDPDDHQRIVTWGIDADWLQRELSSFEGFAEGYTHPIYPVLDLAVAHELWGVVVAADFTLSNGAVLLGFLAGTHAVGLFVEDTTEILNRNLPDWARESAQRIERALGAPAFPAHYRAHAACAEARESGSLEPWW